MPIYLNSNFWPFSVQVCLLSQTGEWALNCHKGEWNAAIHLKMHSSEGCTVTNWWMSELCRAHFITNKFFTYNLYESCITIISMHSNEGCTVTIWWMSVELSQRWMKRGHSLNETTNSELEFRNVLNTSTGSAIKECNVCVLGFLGIDFVHFLWNM